MKFESSKDPSVGVEWELQLLDPETLDLVDSIMPLMEFFPSAKFVKPEYIQSCVELNTGVCQTSEEAVRDIQETLRRTLRRCDELRISLCSAGTHPFCRRLALITPLPRYRKVETDTGILSHMQITFSLHVHVGMSSGDEAMRVMYRLMPAVPAFVAMSANSAFWRGHDTGHAAYRHRILAAAPNYGLPTTFNDWRAFERFCESAIRCGSIKTFKNIHWDIRPHPDFGTLELRAMDSPSSIERLHGLVAFARSMMLTLSLASETAVSELLPLGLPYWIEHENRYRAAHLGMDADFILDTDGRTRPLRDLAADLIEFSRPAAEQHGDARGLDLARAMLDRTTDYNRQRKIYEETTRASAIVDDLREVLLTSARSEI
ncbi:MAG: YbdK family carboxylate-amine ligase [Woeseiaceae bacterium]|nr:YbdK family carboxylate-amine ligase [Woeseiaceae bacterium]